MPAGMSTPPTDVVRRARRKSAFTGLSMRSVSSMKSAMRSWFARSSSWRSGFSASCFKRRGQQPGRRLLPRREEERGGAPREVTSGVDPSG